MRWCRGEDRLREEREWHVSVDKEVVVEMECGV